MQAKVCMWTTVSGHHHVFSTKEHHCSGDSVPWDQF